MENKRKIYMTAVEDDFLGKYKWSVKVPEVLTFKEFKHGWDQDDYIHDRNLNYLAEAIYGYETDEWTVTQDYPSECQQGTTALRYHFENERDAVTFAKWVKFELEDYELEQSNHQSHVNAYLNHQDAVAEQLDIQYEASMV